MPVPKASQHLTRRLLRDDVHDFLRDAIVAGTLRPGQVLNSADIEQATGASQPPVRDALHLLRAEGFVDVLPQRVTRVRHLDPEPFADAMAVAHELMTTVVRRRLPELDPDDLARLRQYRDVHAASLDLETAAIKAGALLDCLARPFLRHEGNAILDRVSEAIALHLRWVANASDHLAGSLSWGSMRAAALVAAAELGDVTAAVRVLDDWFDLQVTGCVALISSSAVPASCEETTARVLLEDLPHEKVTLGRSFLRDQAFDTLVEKIADGTLAPGERLREDELMRWLGISRSPLREAMTRLETVALVESQPGRYTRVMPADPERSRAAKEFVLLLGGMIVRGAALDETCWATLDDSAEAVMQAAAQKRTLVLVRGVNDYLLGVARSGGNTAVVTILDHVQHGLYRGLALTPPLEFKELGTAFTAFHRSLRVGEKEAALGYLVEFMALFPPV